MNPSVEAGFVASLARVLVRRPWAIVALAAAMSVLGGGLAWSSLRVETNRMALIGEHHACNQPFLRLQDRHTPLAYHRSV